MNIYVGNLNYRVQEEDVKDVFETYGNVNCFRVIVSAAPVDPVIKGTPLT